MIDTSLLFALLAAAPLADLPAEAELDRFPPAELVQVMLEHNRKFHEQLTLLWYVTPWQRDVIAGSKGENSRLHEGWYLLSMAHTCDSVVSRRWFLGEFRRDFGEYYLVPGSMPAIPHWRIRR